MRQMALACVLGVAALLSLPRAADAAVGVFLDFGAQWITSLGTVASNAGVSAFTAGERATIESNILSALNTMYDDFDVTFSTSVSGTTETIDFNATTMGTALGSALGDFFNFFSGDTANVFVENHDVFIESGDLRSVQIAELSAGLAGTAGHELGHTFGLAHHHAYGDRSISPSNYANTSGIQNTHVMATDTTGQTEIDAQAALTFSQFSELVLEAGGAFGGNTLAASPLSGLTEVGDIGDSAATAATVSLTSLPISGTNAAVISADLNANSDFDYYRFTVDGPTALSVGIFSEIFASSFDSVLTVFDTDGTTTLFNFDDVFYSGNTYNSGTRHSSEDAFLINGLLPTAGTYFVRVRSFGLASSGDYGLLIGATDVPEPTSLTLMAVGMFGFGAYQWRRRRKQKKQSSGDSE